MPLEPPQRIPRVDRWLARRGRGLGVISWPAARLLDERLRVRRQAGFTMLAGDGLGVAAMCMSMVSSDLDASGPADAAAIRWWAASLILIGVAVVAGVLLIRRRERRVAAGLPRRVSPDIAATAWGLFGLPRTINFALVLAVNLGVLAALIGLGAPVALVVTDGLTFLLLAGFSLIGVRQLMSAPAVAVDASSLAIDRRLRASDFHTVAMLPLVLLAVGITAPLGLFTSEYRSMFPLVMIAFFVNPVTLLIESYAQSNDARRRPPVSPMPTGGAW